MQFVFHPSSSPSSPYLTKSLHHPLTIYLILCHRRTLTPSHASSANKQRCTAPVFVCILLYWTSPLCATFTLVLHHNAYSSCLLSPSSLPPMCHTTLPVVQQLWRIYAGDFRHLQEIIPGFTVPWSLPLLWYGFNAAKHLRIHLDYA